MDDTYIIEVLIQGVHVQRIAKCARDHWDHATAAQTCGQMVAR